MCNKFKYCDCFVEYTNFKDDLSEYKFLRCNKSYQRKFDEKLKRVFLIHATFRTMITIILLLRKGVYLYEYMDVWEKFNKTSLPEKEDFYSHLNMEDISDVDYAHVKRVCKDFQTKSLGEYYESYVQSDTHYCWLM